MDDEASTEELETLRRHARETDEQLATLRFENAVIKAGLDLGDRRTSYFLAAYNGDITAEAIRAEWESAGFGRQHVSAAELRAHEQMSRAMAGGEDPGSEDFLSGLSHTTSPEDVMTLANRYGMPTTNNRPE